MNRCVDNCKDYGLMAQQGEQPRECVSKCEKFTYLGNNTCVDSCKEYYNATIDMFYEMTSVRVCTDKCGAEYPYYVLETINDKKMWKC